MTEQIIPYSFGSSVAPEFRASNMQVAELGVVQGLLFTLDAQRVETTVAMIERWFEEIDQVVLISTGVSGKLEMGFVMMEWDEGYAVDTLFQSILKHDPSIVDYVVYARKEGV